MYVCAGEWKTVCSLCNKIFHYICFYVQWVLEALLLQVKHQGHVTFHSSACYWCWEWVGLYTSAVLVCFHGMHWDSFTFFFFFQLYVKFGLLSSNWWSLFVGKSKEAEIKRINKELANIRSKFKGDKTLDGYQKKKYVCKLLFIFLLGHDIDFGHMEAVNLLSSNKYSEKQIVSINQLVLS